MLMANCPTLNQLVVGSSPARGTNVFNSFPTNSTDYTAVTVSLTFPILPVLGVSFGLSDVSRTYHGIPPKRDNRDNRDNRGKYILPPCQSSGAPRQNAPERIVARWFQAVHPKSSQNGDLGILQGDDVGGLLEIERGPGDGGGLVLVILGEPIEEGAAMHVVGIAVGAAN